MRCGAGILSTVSAGPNARSRVAKSTVFWYEIGNTIIVPGLLNSAYGSRPANSALPVLTTPIVGVLLASKNPRHPEE